MTTRISGLASGMDIDSMVKKLMQAERKPLDKLSQQKQWMEWKRDSYREASVKMVTFQQDKLFNLSKSSMIDALKTNIIGNTSAVGATASSSASGIFDVEVLALATSSKAASTGSIELNIGTAPSDWTKVKLSDIKGSGIDVLNPDQVTVSIGTAEIKIDPQNETLESFIQKINSNKEAGVNALIDSATGKVSITNKAAGKGEVTLTGDIFNALKLGNALTGGSDAKVVINGLEMTRSTNNFTVNGLALTLNQVSNGTSTRIEVTKDTDKVVATVKEFVDAYNELLSFMNNKVNEERYSKYSPLTTEQKVDMSDDEIKLWTDKAKSGTLKNDSILRSTIDSMRTAIIEGVQLPDGSKLSFAQLGITTGSFETRGKLSLDVDKLRSAVDANPDIVSNFFNSKSSTTPTNSVYSSEDGIFSRLNKISTVALSKMADTAGTSKASTDLTASFLENSSMGLQLTSLDRSISEMTSRLNRKETNYYKKFTAMETAINKYNSISSSLTSFL